MESSPIYNKLKHYLIEYACIWIFLTLICVNWRRTENEERNDIEREREREVVMVCVVVHLVNHLSKKPFRPLYIFKHVLKNISFCSFERMGLPLVKSLRSIPQSLGSQLRLWTMYISYLHNGNNQRRSDASLHDWPHNDKTDLRLYLLWTNHNLKKKQNIEVGLMQY